MSLILFILILIIAILLNIIGEESGYDEWKVAAIMIGLCLLLWAFVAVYQAGDIRHPVNKNLTVEVDNTVGK